MIRLTFQPRLQPKDNQIDHNSQHSTEVYWYRGKLLCVLCRECGRSSYLDGNQRIRKWQYSLLRVDR